VIFSVQSDGEAFDRPLWLNTRLSREEPFLLHLGDLGLEVARRNCIRLLEQQATRLSICPWIPRSGSNFWSRLTVEADPTGPTFNVPLAF